MQTVKTLRNGVQYVKTVDAFSSIHTFMVPASDAAKLKGCVQQFGPRAVKSVAILSRSGLEAHHRAGNLFRVGDGATVLWRA